MGKNCNKKGYFLLEWNYAKRVNFVGVLNDGWGHKSDHMGGCSDPSVIRVETPTTAVRLCMNPGVPIMKSRLSQLEIVNYVYDVLGEKDAQVLANGKNEYE